MHKYLAACGCNIGRIRKNNEDNFYFNGIVLQAENRGLRDILFTSGTLASPFCVGVFDGMGGEAFGEDASYIGAKVLKEKCFGYAGDPKDVLLDACMGGKCTDLRTGTKTRGGSYRSTMAALCLEGENAVLLNLGDSKAFCFGVEPWFKSPLIILIRKG